MDLVDDKVWIQRDVTEEGIADELVRGGMLKEQIVWAFHKPHIQPYPGFAVA
ncbi:element excision factor XisI family protein [Acaryochloris sp. IP29b_bin.148]|uniref:element excision factor XisI family protein n=1 Tax=Acaryochloris sp. IP29b_bin.148 TaxID=2969218 RepID=UPI00262BBC68|nr:element excision factor XisI family protein [Acaryochloris sp. IP29b_bin.148]